jgi:hypothetical protein
VLVKTSLNATLLGEPAGDWFSGSRSEENGDG